MALVFRTLGIIIPVSHWYVVYLYVLFSDYEYGALIVLGLLLIFELFIENILGKASSFNIETQNFKYRYVNIYQIPLFLCALSQLGFVIWAGYEFTQLQGETVRQCTLLVLVGLTNGTIGFNVAHELMHQNSKISGFFSSLILMTVLMPSYKVEHIYGHHVDACTSHDASSAPRNLGYYRFLVRALILNFIKAWTVAFRRFRKQSFHRSHLGFMLLAYALVCSILVAVYALGGLNLLLFMVAQSLIAISVMELTNYIQHYGLVRKQFDNGKYERFGQHHAWDSNYNFSNLILLNLPRHSDHHLKPNKEYPLLESMKNSPKLPYGYLASLILALIPPAWCYIMNKQIDKFMEN